MFIIIAVRHQLLLLPPLLPFAPFALAAHPVACWLLLLLLLLLRTQLLLLLTCCCWPSSTISRDGFILQQHHINAASIRNDAAID
jgi:hypothetical protein